MKGKNPSLGTPFLGLRELEGRGRARHPPLLRLMMPKKRQSPFLFFFPRFNFSLLGWLASTERQDFPPLRCDRTRRRAHPFLPCSVSQHPSDDWERSSISLPTPAEKYKGDRPSPSFFFGLSSIRRVDKAKAPPSLPRRRIEGRSLLPPSFFRSLPFDEVGLPLFPMDMIADDAPFPLNLLLG